jgi:hypothetical protein
MCSKDFLYAYELNYIRSKQELDLMTGLASKGNLYASHSLKLYMDTEKTNKEALILVYRKCRRKTYIFRRKPVSIIIYLLQILKVNYSRNVPLLKKLC